MRVTRVVDLSRTVGPRTQVYPGDPVPSSRPLATVERDGFALHEVVLGSQSGTHLDAPAHFRADGAPVDRVDPADCVGPGVVADLTGRAPRHPVDWPELAPYAPLLGRGTVLLLHTGWAARYGTPEYFDHPYLTGAAARGLLAAGVRAVGVDAPSVDETPGPGGPDGGAADFPAHRAIAAAGGVIVENLCRLEQIDFPDPLVSVLPIRLAGLDGAPVRAVAMRIEP
ncbi:cyclase family protein [Allonocardiopsis opalescens]|uniref:Kynurenine formamidase n=1 Tax=Allonocardiopsis opalescens TaxID=1144618 RepID=A0A2T0PXT8_9ACTN|nr:cyclase family protein [Allonocardiopsis opalescens]PRX96345.1 kynurenine formamidase [Allonocardiopsis opalescens]